MEKGYMRNTDYTLDLNEQMYSQSAYMYDASDRSYHIERRKQNRKTSVGLFFLIPIALLCLVGFCSLVWESWTLDWDAMMGQEGATDMMLSFSFIFLISVCNIFACFAFRRNSVKGGVCFIYILSLLAVLAWDFMWSADYFFEGDINAFLAELITSNAGYTLIMAAVYAIISVITFISGSHKGDYCIEDEGRMNPHVWIRFIALGFFLFTYPVFAFYIWLFKLMVRAIRKTGK